MGFIKMIFPFPAIKKKPQEEEGCTASKLYVFTLHRGLMLSPILKQGRD